MAPGAASSRSIGWGIAAAVAAFGGFASADATIKWLSDEFAALHSLFIGTLAAFVPICIFLKISEGRVLTWPKRPALTLLRALTLTTSAACIVSAVTLMPLAEAYALLFTGPLIVTALAGPVLGEHVGWYRWGAVLVGFAGVLLILRPGLTPIGLGHVLALGAAFTFAASSLILRHIGNTESISALLITLLVVTEIFTLPFAIIGWEPLHLRAILLMCVSGTFAGCANIFTVLAFRLAPAGVVAPFIYTQMIWGLIFGLILFGDWPEELTLVGAAIVIASGLFVFYRETIAGRRRQTSRPASTAPPTISTQANPTATSSRPKPKPINSNVDNKGAP